jgi:hypothetical protein
VTSRFSEASSCRRGSMRRQRCQHLHFQAKWATALRKNYLDSRALRHRCGNISEALSFAIAFAMFVDHSIVVRVKMSLADLGRRRQWQCTPGEPNLHDRCVPCSGSVKDDCSVCWYTICEEECVMSEPSGCAMSDNNGSVTRQRQTCRFRQYFVV